MPKRLLLVEEDQGQEHPGPRWEELREILIVCWSVDREQPGSVQPHGVSGSPAGSTGLEQTRYTQSRAADN